MLFHLKSKFRFLLFLLIFSKELVPKNPYARVLAHFMDQYEQDQSWENLSKLILHKAEYEAYKEALNKSFVLLKTVPILFSDAFRESIKFVVHDCVYRTIRSPIKIVYLGYFCTVQLNTNQVAILVRDTLPISLESTIDQVTDQVIRDVCMRTLPPI